MLLIEAHRKGWEDSEHGQAIRALIWQTKIMDELATAFIAAAYKKKFARGQSVGSKYNPFKKEERPEKTQARQAQEEHEQREVAALWFGSEGEKLMREAQALEQGTINK